MPIKDLHKGAFDEATIAKLQIFEDYAQAWIPTFVMQNTPRICIFDFFAGTGKDINGVDGSAIRILKKIREQIHYIFKNNVKIDLYLNEFEPNKVQQKKFKALKDACSAYLADNKDVNRAINIHYYNEDFYQLFPKLVTHIRAFPSLVYLDQNGVKALSNEYLAELENTTQTDFLYFVSSSYVWRFGKTEEFRSYLNIDIEKAKENPYKFIHRSIITQLREALPKESKLKLYPFSLKKQSNIHGIIFGASHPNAVEKFLTIAWKQNQLNGEANFDINGDIPTKTAQLDLFESEKLNKIDQFKLSVKSKILSQEITNNFDLLTFVFEEGHIGKHADECLRNMKKNGEITYNGLSPLVTYKNVYKYQRKTVYQILK